MAKVKGKLLKNGTVVLEGEGFEGPSCSILINALSERLGVVQDEHLLNEYYHEEQHIEVGSDSTK